MPAQDSIASGMDTTYVPQDVAYLRHMEANRAAARKNLAAMCCDWYAVDPTRPVPPGHVGAGLAAADFRLLADALGLDDQPERKPGTCADCGANLPVEAARPGGTSIYKQGRCRPCTIAARAKGRDLNAPMPAHPYVSPLGPGEDNYSMAQKQRPCEDCGWPRANRVHRLESANQSGGA